MNAPALPRLHAYLLQVIATAAMAGMFVLATDAFGYRGQLASRGSSTD